MHKDSRKVLIYFGTNVSVCYACVCVCVMPDNFIVMSGVILIDILKY